MGSEEDKYAPIESSIIGIGSKLKSIQNEKEIVVKEMMLNFLKQVKAKTFIRTQIKFNKVLENDFDHFIGRKAHIEVIINNILMRFITFHYEFLFIN